MKRAEITFCERWCELRGSDDLVLWLHHPDASLREVDPFPAGSVPSPLGPIIQMSPAAREHSSIYALTPRGEDLVASYEAALAQGLKITADEDRQAEMMRASKPGGCRFNTPPAATCPDCENGLIGIPIEYGRLGGIVRAWPATCPKCEGSGEVACVGTAGPVYMGVDLGGVESATFVTTIGPGGFRFVSSQTESVKTPADTDWQPLTREFVGANRGAIVDLKTGAFIYAATKLGDASVGGAEAKPDRTRQPLTMALAVEWEGEEVEIDETYTKHRGRLAVKGHMISIGDRAYCPVGQQVRRVIT